MVTYENLLKKPHVAKSPIGMSLVEFDESYAELERVYDELQSTAQKMHRYQTKRQRAVGVGRKHKYALRDRFLLSLFWLRAYRTYEMLGFFYDLNKTNIEDNCKEVLDVLEKMSAFNSDHPPEERTKLRSVQEEMDVFPDVRLVIDAKEQRIKRPVSKKGSDGKKQDRQKSYFSGKKKTNIIKNQIGMASNSLIEDVSECFPRGSTRDLTLLRKTDWLSKLEDGAVVMMDKGDDDIPSNYPDKKLYLSFKARRNYPLTGEQKSYNRFLVKYHILWSQTLRNSINSRCLLSYHCVNNLFSSS